MSTKPLISSIALLSVLALAGCNTTPKLSAGAGGMDMFAPTKMRLHPLSRIMPADKNSPPVIEARLEFTDQFGDVTKSAGALYFELFDYEALSPNHHGSRLHLANFDLSTPESNKEHWDAITRTYLFKIPLTADTLKKKETRAVLSATLTLPNDGRLNDDITISLK